MNPPRRLHPVSESQRPTSFATFDQPQRNGQHHTQNHSNGRTISSKRAQSYSHLYPDSRSHFRDQMENGSSLRRPQSTNSIHGLQNSYLPLHIDHKKHSNDKRRGLTSGGKNDGGHRASEMMQRTHSRPCNSYVSYGERDRSESNQLDYRMKTSLTQRSKNYPEIERSMALKRKPSALAYDRPTKAHQNSHPSNNHRRGSPPHAIPFNGNFGVIDLTDDISEDESISPSQFDSPVRKHLIAVKYESPSRSPSPEFRIPRQHRNGFGRSQQAALQLQKEVERSQARKTGKSASMHPKSSTGQETQSSRDGVQAWQQSRLLKNVGVVDAAEHIDLSDDEHHVRKRTRASSRPASAFKSAQPLFDDETRQIQQPQSNGRSGSKSLGRGLLRSDAHFDADPVRPALMGDIPSTNAHNPSKDGSRPISRDHFEKTHSHLKPNNTFEDTNGRESLSRHRRRNRSPPQPDGGLQPNGKRATAEFARLGGVLPSYLDVSGSSSGETNLLAKRRQMAEHGQESGDDWDDSTAAAAASFQKSLSRSYHQLQKPFEKLPGFLEGSKSAQTWRKTNNQPVKERDLAGNEGFVYSPHSKSKLSTIKQIEENSQREQNTIPRRSTKIESLIQVGRAQDTDANRKNVGMGPRGRQILSSDNEQSLGRRNRTDIGEPEQKESEELVIVDHRRLSNGEPVSRDAAYRSLRKTGEQQLRNSQVQQNNLQNYKTNEFPDQNRKLSESTKSKVEDTLQIKSRQLDNGTMRMNPEDASRFSLHKEKPAQKRDEEKREINKAASEAEELGLPNRPVGIRTAPVPPTVHKLPSPAPLPHGRVDTAAQKSVKESPQKLIGQHEQAKAPTTEKRIPPWALQKSSTAGSVPNLTVRSGNDKSSSGLARNLDNALIPVQNQFNTSLNDEDSLFVQPDEVNQAGARSHTKKDGIHGVAGKEQKPIVLPNGKVLGVLPSLPAKTVTEKRSVPSPLGKIKKQAAKRSFAAAPHLVNPRSIDSSESLHEVIHKAGISKSSDSSSFDSGSGQGRTGNRPRAIGKTLQELSPEDALLVILRRQVPQMKWPEISKVWQDICQIDGSDHYLSSRFHRLKQVIPVATLMSKEMREEDESILYRKAEQLLKRGNEPLNDVTGIDQKQHQEEHTLPADPHQDLIFGPAIENEKPLDQIAINSRLAKVIQGARIDKPLAALDGRPTVGGKSLNQEQMDAYYATLNDEYETVCIEGSGDEGSERECSPFDPDYQCHFEYRVKRRECGLNEELEDEDFYFCGPVFQSLREANEAATAEFNRERMYNPKWPLTLWQSQVDKNWMLQHSGQSSNGKLQVWVERGVRMWGDGVPAEAKRGSFARRVYDICTKTTVMVRVEEVERTEVREATEHEVESGPNSAQEKPSDTENLDTLLTVNEAAEASFQPAEQVLSQGPSVGMGEVIYDETIFDDLFDDMGGLETLLPLDTLLQPTAALIGEPAQQTTFALEPKNPQDDQTFQLNQSHQLSKTPPTITSQPSSTTTTTTNLTTTGPVYTILDQANREAGRIITALKFQRDDSPTGATPRYIERKAAFEAQMTERMDELEQDGAFFSEKAVVGNQLTEVWVRERMLEGPRNI